MMNLPPGLSGPLVLPLAPAVQGPPSQNANLNRTSRRSSQLAPAAALEESQNLGGGLGGLCVSGNAIQLVRTLRARSRTDGPQSLHKHIPPNARTPVRGHPMAFRGENRPSLGGGISFRQKTPRPDFNSTVSGEMRLRPRAVTGNPARAADGGLDQNNVDLNASAPVPDIHGGGAVLSHRPNLPRRGAPAGWAAKTGGRVGPPPLDLGGTATPDWGASNSVNSVSGEQEHTARSKESCKPSLPKLPVASKTKAPKTDAAPDAVTTKVKDDALDLQRTESTASTASAANSNSGDEPKSESAASGDDRKSVSEQRSDPKPVKKKRKSGVKPKSNKSQTASSPRKDPKAQGTTPGGNNNVNNKPRLNLGMNNTVAGWFRTKNEVRSPTFSSGPNDTQKSASPVKRRNRIAPLPLRKNDDVVPTNEDATKKLQKMHVVSPSAPPTLPAIGGERKTATDRKELEVSNLDVSTATLGPDDAPISASGLDIGLIDTDISCAVADISGAASVTIDEHSPVHFTMPTSIMAAPKNGRRRSNSVDCGGSPGPRDSTGLGLDDSTVSAPNALNATAPVGGHTRGGRKRANTDIGLGLSVKGVQKADFSQTTTDFSKLLKRRKTTTELDDPNKRYDKVSRAAQKLKFQKRTKNRAVTDADLADDPVLSRYHCHTFGFYRDDKGKKVTLPNRGQVASILHELDQFLLTPISRKFNLRYHSFSEHHCLAKKAGITTKDPMIVRPEGGGMKIVGYRTTIQIRVRVHPTKGDPRTQMLKKGTLMAICLHEIAHLRHMNHGRNFMLFLRDLFAYAHDELKVFDCAVVGDNEIPSPWPWENKIYQSNGQADEAELNELFNVDKKRRKEAEAEKATPAKPVDGDAGSPSPAKSPGENDSKPNGKSPASSPVSSIGESCHSSSSGSTDATKSERASPNSSPATEKGAVQLRPLSRSGSKSLSKAVSNDSSGKKSHKKKKKSKKKSSKKSVKAADETGCPPLPLSASQIKAELISGSSCSSASSSCCADDDIGTPSSAATTSVVAQTQRVLKAILADDLRKEQERKLRECIAPLDTFRTPQRDRTKVFAAVDAQENNPYSPVNVSSFFKGRDQCCGGDASPEVAAA